MQKEGEIMDPAKKKELINKYKKAPELGGIYCIECSGNHRKWIKSTRDIDSIQRRFAFSCSTKACPDPAMRTEWKEYGTESFSFRILETLKRGETQTVKEFCDDIAALLELWLEKNNEDARNE